MANTEAMNLILDVVHGESPVTMLRNVGVEFSVTKNNSETIISTKNPKNLGIKVEMLDLARGLLKALEEKDNPSALKDWATAVYHCSCFEFDMPDNQRFEWMEFLDTLYSASLYGSVNASALQLARRIVARG